MNTSNENQYIVKIYVDKDAACLAGYDQHGAIERTIKPSELTEQQRKALVDINFIIGEGNTGAKIDGTESIPELLDKAQRKVIADQEKEQKRIDEAVAILINSIVEGTAYNPHFVNERTGQVELERNDKALVRVMLDKTVKRWTDRYFYQSVGNLYFGKDKSIDEIRDRVLSSPEVTERIASLEKVADHIQKQLDDAKVTRDRITADRKAEAERIAATKAENRKQQIGEFVMKHMPDLDRRRFELGILPESVIVDAMTVRTFAELDRQFMPVSRQDLDGAVRRKLLEDHDIDEPESDVLYLDRDIETLTDGELIRAEAIACSATTLFHDAAKTEMVVLVGYLEAYRQDDDPEVHFPVMRVSITVGEFDLVREYRLSVDADNVEG